jgi:hypothetical protein
MLGDEYTLKRRHLPLIHQGLGGGRGCASRGFEIEGTTEAAIRVTLEQLQFVQPPGRA